MGLLIYVTELSVWKFNIVVEPGVPRSIGFLSTQWCRFSCRDITLMLTRTHGHGKLERRIVGGNNRVGQSQCTVMPPIFLSLPLTSMLQCHMSASLPARWFPEEMPLLVLELSTHGQICGRFLFHLGNDRTQVVAIFVHSHCGVVAQVFVQNCHCAGSLLPFQECSPLIGRHPWVTILVFVFTDVTHWFQPPWICRIGLIDYWSLWDAWELQ